MNIKKLILILLLGAGAAFAHSKSGDLEAQEFIVAEGFNMYQTEFAVFSVGDGFESHQFESVPLGTFDFGGTIGVRHTGFADTIVQRLDPLVCDPFCEHVDTVVLAMSFRSVEPIDLGSGFEFVSTTVSSSSGWTQYPVLDLFDFEWNVDLLFTGETSGTTVTQSIIIGGLDWPWGRTPLENGVLQITGVNRLLDGLGTTTQDFWPRYELHISDNKFGQEASGDLTNATARLIIAPTETSSNLPAEFGTATANVTNQSGLSIPYTPVDSGFDDFLGMGPTHDGGPEGNVWLIAGSVANFDMDFGIRVPVDAMAIWNKDDIFGVRDFNLLAANNPEFSGAVTLVSDSLALQLGNPIPTPFEQFDFAETRARYFRIAILNNHGAFFTGLGEVVFSRLPGAGLGDINHDGVVDLLDVAPFVDLLVNWIYQVEADIDQNGHVDLDDVAPFVDLLTGG